MTNLSDQTLIQNVRALADGTTTSEALVTETLALIERDQALNVWLEIADRDARLQNKMCWNVFLY